MKGPSAAPMLTVISSESSLWMQDVAKAQSLALEPIFGAETAKNICAGLFDVAVLRTLSGLLHPTVYGELHRLLPPVRHTAAVGPEIQQLRQRCVLRLRRACLQN